MSDKPNKPRIPWVKPGNRIEGTIVIALLGMLFLHLILSFVMDYREIEVSNATAAVGGAIISMVTLIVSALFGERTRKQQDEDE